MQVWMSVACLFIGVAHASGGTANCMALSRVSRQISQDSKLELWAMLPKMLIAIFLTKRTILDFNLNIPKTKKNYQVL